jgi:hypothetical protein
MKTKADSSSAERIAIAGCLSFQGVDLQCSDSQRVVCPSGACYLLYRPTAVAVVGLDGRKSSGNQRISIPFDLHK